MSVEDIVAATDNLVDAFSHHDVPRYFECFAPKATFIFYTVERGLESRAEYETLWSRWERENGFRVISCSLSERRVLDLGAVAIVSLVVRTVVETRTGREATKERETIVFERGRDGWRAVHEHLSSFPSVVPRSE
jgi:ketosteroid isomerase-like protein